MRRVRCPGRSRGSPEGVSLAGSRDPAGSVEWPPAGRTTGRKALGSRLLPHGHDALVSLQGLVDPGVTLVPGVADLAVAFDVGLADGDGVGAQRAGELVSGVCDFAGSCRRGTAHAASLPSARVRTWQPVCHQLATPAYAGDDDVIVTPR